MGSVSAYKSTFQSPVAAMQSSQENSGLDDFTDQCHRVLACLVFVTQSALLNYYLIYLTASNYWFLWILVDFAILGLMVYAYIVTYVRKRTPAYSTTSAVNRLLEANHPGELPFAYGVWLLYGAGLVTRLAILYKSHVTRLTAAGGAFGPGMLQVTLGITMAVLYFLVRSVSLRRASDLSGWQATERWLIAEDSLNILDAIDILQPLFSATQRVKLLAGVEDAILAFACLALLLPLVHLSVYTTTKFNEPTGYHHQQSHVCRVIRALHALSAVFLVNIPLLVLRMVLWNHSGLTVSAFFVKDILFVYVYIVQLIRLIIDANNGGRAAAYPATRGAPGRPGRFSADFAKSSTSVHTVS